jgi:hypothetical protein
MVEVSGAVGAKQVHEVDAGGSATPGCSAAFAGHGPITAVMLNIRVNRVLVARVLLATALMVALFILRQPAAKAAIIIGGLLLLTRRVESKRVYAEIDWSLLLMFAGLFIIVAGAQRALLTPDFVGRVIRLHLDQVPILSAVTAVLSNLVSNVPAVLMMKPFVASLPNHATAWFTIAMASALAGKFTILGSIANLIVVQKAATCGVVISFWAAFHPAHAAPLARGSPDKIKSKKGPSLVGCYPGHPTGPREILLREARRSEIR